MPKSYIKLGEYNVICDKCAKKVKSSQTRMDGAFKNLRVCMQCYEPYPDALKPTKIPKGEGKAVANARPRPAAVYDNPYGSTWENDWEMWSNEWSIGEWEEG